MTIGRFAFILFLTGLSFLGQQIFAQRHDFIAEQFDRLTPLTRAELLAAPAGGDVLVEGRISPRNEMMEHGLVAYTRERGVPDIRNDIVWVPDEFVTPPLVIDMADGPITAAGNYALAGDLPLITDGEHRFSGLSAGDDVVVLGRPAAGGRGEQIIPGHIVRGDRQRYPRPGPSPAVLAVGTALIMIGGAIMARLLQQGFSPFGKRNSGRR